MEFFVMMQRADDLTAFKALASNFARSLRPGDVVALEGELGAGKTTFVAAVVRALHGSDEVASPTFTFWHRYAGQPPLEHLDLYRIENPAEAAELGLHDAFDARSVTFVEWPERLPELVPRAAIRVRISGAGSGPRDVQIVRSNA
ncbi:MAG: tRNA (adenosine(37)-N6)-threonylcarbamoyltransferase complex ATPase subunit type 1 TsaE [Candidatus Eremiobacteraeota bacterium]|nr:tRNA (adenosine(37)-N6)-threonylcarbamoyltransferase complex ATPase subunit type 1 TsaE [Candidatus Eremiobacteraeota bacterium]